MQKKIQIMIKDKIKHENRLKNIYSKRASNYNYIHSLFTLFFDRHWRRITVKYFEKPAHTVLEIGTGSGLTSAKILNAGKAEAVVGVDLNLNMLEQTRKNKIKRGVFIPLNANALELPFKNDSFDAAVTMLGIGGVYNVEQVFREIIRVLKNKGEIYSIEMCTPRHTFLKFVHKKMVEKLVDLWWGFQDIDIEFILKKLEIKDYQLKYRKDMLLGSVYQLAARIHK